MKAIFLTLALAAAAYAQKGTCTLNIPVQWTIQPTYVDGATPSAVCSDGGAYIDGQTGVTAKINVCSTGDATLSLSSPRYYAVNFAEMLHKTSYTPAYAANGQTQDDPFVNVRNVTYVPAGLSRADEYQFTTQVHCCSGLIMMNTAAQAAADNGPDSTAANNP